MSIRQEQIKSAFKSLISEQRETDRQENLKNIEKKLFDKTVGQSYMLNTLLELERLVEEEIRDNSISN